MPYYHSKWVFQLTWESNRCCNLSIRITHFSVTWKISSTWKRPPYLPCFTLIFLQKYEHHFYVIFWNHKRPACMCTNVSDWSYRSKNQTKSVTVLSRNLRRAKLLLVQTTVGREDRERGGKVFSNTFWYMWSSFIYWACYFRDTPLSEHLCVTASSNCYPNVILWPI